MRQNYYNIIMNNVLTPSNVAKAAAVLLLVHGIHHVVRVCVCE